MVRSEFCCLLLTPAFSLLYLVPDTVAILKKNQQLKCVNVEEEHGNSFPSCNKMLCWNLSFKLLLGFSVCFICIETHCVRYIHAYFKWKPDNNVSFTGLTNNLACMDQKWAYEVGSEGGYVIMKGLCGSWWKKEWESLTVDVCRLRTRKTG